MRKRILKLGLITIISLFLISCNSGLKLSQELILNNLQEVDSLVTKEYTFSNNSLSSFTVFSDEYEKYGIIIVADENNHLSCWSLVLGKILFPFEENIDIRVFQTTSIGIYIEKKDKNNRITVYDVAGHIVLKNDKYQNYTIQLQKFPFWDENNKIIDYEYMELIRYKTEEAHQFQLGDTYLKFEVDPSNGNRKEIPSPEYFPQNRTIINLEKYNLPGYYATSIGQYYYIYDKNDKLINMIRFGDYDISVMIDGKIIGQQKILLNPENKEYDFIMFGNKYLLKSYSIDILTGKIKELKLNYLFEYIKSLKNSKDKSIYGFAKIFNITNNSLSNISHNVIINSKGEILAETGILDFTNPVKLDDEYIYDSFSKYIFSINLEPVLKLQTRAEVVSEENLIVTTYSDLYGAMAYDGKIIIPFEYRSLRPYFYNGKTYGIHSNGKRFLITNNGTINQLDNNTLYVDDNLLVRYIEKATPTKNKAIFIDYSGKPYFEIDYSRSLPYSDFRYNYITTMYGNYRYLKYDYLGETKYLVFKID